jgi:hypothetical protein
MNTFQGRRAGATHFSMVPHAFTRSGDALTDSEFRLISWLMSHADYFKWGPQLAQVQLGWSRAKFYRTMADLLDKGYVREVEPTKTGNRRCLIYDYQPITEPLNKTTEQEDQAPSHQRDTHRLTSETPPSHPRDTDRLTSETHKKTIDQKTTLEDHIEGLVVPERSTTEPNEGRAPKRPKLTRVDLNPRSVSTAEARTMIEAVREFTGLEPAQSEGVILRLAKTYIATHDETSGPANLSRVLKLWDRLEDKPDLEGVFRMAQVEHLGGENRELLEASITAIELLQKHAAEVAQ